ncbi:probable NAD(P)H dehydrogenase subunit CRR3, chloroplastic [Elaeis guineensis]|uniref:Probable NAD(P)H dehydrogenase subunit CRR3, chloroplastic n=1 Tax=Elaeis guineensis var. tenera TaxID=51953 RepID=A0A6I9RAZ6_ELAGV|nr:probable NAD(P)H dehydrogenase subunit CRR3, chloroplastic [Elaeis guineensis]
MGRISAAAGLLTATAAVPHFSPPATAAAATRARTRTILASQTARPSHRTNGSPPRKQPSVAEVERAIGVASDPFQSSTSSSSSPFLDFVSSTPIGQAEGPTERKIRETAEWVVDHTEAHARSGQRILMMLSLKILPVWLLLLLVASGVVKLPFDLPFMDDLIT